MPDRYSTWDYYHSTYGGTLTETEYTKKSFQAAGEINRQTCYKSLKAPDLMDSALCDCECELVDCLADFEKSYWLLPDGIHSINNDGFSVSAGSGNETGDLRSVSQSAKIRRICQKHLLYPVNLMYPGV